MGLPFQMEYLVLHSLILLLEGLCLFKKMALIIFITSARKVVILFSELLTLKIFFLGSLLVVEELGWLSLPEAVKFFSTLHSLN
jgi:hypothetical protein